MARQAARRPGSHAGDSCRPVHRIVPAAIARLGRADGDCHHRESILRRQREAGWDHPHPRDEESNRRAYAERLGANAMNEVRIASGESRRLTLPFSCRVVDPGIS
jgi:hypothetical protein